MSTDSYWGQESLCRPLKFPGTSAFILPVGISRLLEYSGQIRTWSRHRRSVANVREILPVSPLSPLWMERGKTPTLCSPAQIIPNAQKFLVFGAGSCAFLLPTNSEISKPIQGAGNRQASLLTTTQMSPHLGLISPVAAVLLRFQNDKNTIAYPARRRWERT